MIRKATREDIPAMIELAKIHLEASSYRELNFDITKTIDFLEDLLTDNSFMVVSEKDGLVVGGMVGDISVPWFSNDKVGIEHILYMHPDHRTGRDVYRLIRSWIEWCRFNGAKQIRPQITSGNEKAVRLYQAMGFSVTGVNFCMNVEE